MSSSTVSATRSTRAALYLRASTTKKLRVDDAEQFKQRPEIQEERLRVMCEQRRWEVVAIYSDRASGRKEARPELTRLMEDARRGLFGVVAVAAFDRFARSVKHLVIALEEFRQLHIEFVSLREAIDTSTPAGRLMYQIIAAMAEFESALISERTTAAMEYSRSHGTRTGNPIGRARRVFRRDLAHQLRREGLSFRAISKQIGVPIATLHAALRENLSERSERAIPSEAIPHSKPTAESTPSSVQKGDL
jgi:DNA invertase Pin-like site-specific DNA recombinase